MRAPRHDLTPASRPPSASGLTLPLGALPAILPSPSPLQGLPSGLQGTARTCASACTLSTMQATRASSTSIMGTRCSGHARKCGRRSAPGVGVSGVLTSASVCVCVLAGRSGPCCAGRRASPPPALQVSLVGVGSSCCKPEAAVGCSRGWRRLTPGRASSRSQVPSAVPGCRQLVAAWR